MQRLPPHSSRICSSVECEWFPTSVSWPVSPLLRQQFDHRLPAGDSSAPFPRLKPLRLYDRPIWRHRRREGQWRGTIFQKNRIYYLMANLSSTLQGIAVRVYLPTLQLTLCNIHLPWALPLRRADLATVLSRLPTPPYILLVDFNNKYILWDGKFSDDRGTSVYDVCVDFDVILMKKSAHTFLCLRPAASSALDLPFRRTSWAVHFDLSVVHNLHRSDHYPLNSHMTTPSLTASGPAKWTNRRAEWAYVAHKSHGGRRSVPTHFPLGGGL
jgi:hypothetical protein